MAFVSMHVSSEIYIIDQGNTIGPNSGPWERLDM